MDVRLRKRVGPSDINRELLGGLVMNPFIMYSIGRAWDPTTSLLSLLGTPKISHT